MLPALAEQDLTVFGEALHEFNARAGEWFAAAQGGRYATEEVAALVRWLRGQGVRGVGQSSWGPTVFAVVEAAQAAFWQRRLEERFTDLTLDLRTAPGRNAGAQSESGA
jgi:predicted sugar kinase